MIGLDADKHADSTGNISKTSTFLLNRWDFTVDLNKAIMTASSETKFELLIDQRKFSDYFNKEIQIV